MNLKFPIQIVLCVSVRYKFLVSLFLCLFNHDMHRACILATSAPFVKKHFMSFFFLCMWHLICQHVYLIMSGIFSF